MEGADKLLWSVQVDHQLFALEKLDVTVSVSRAGRDEDKSSTWLCVYELRKGKGSMTQLKKAGIISG